MVSMLIFHLSKPFNGINIVVINKFHVGNCIINCTFKQKYIAIEFFFNLPFNLRTKCE
jgi:hypothetical protein